MHIILFAILTSVAFGAFVLNREFGIAESVVCGAIFCLVIGILAGISIEPLKLKNVKDSLVLVASQSLEVENLEKEIEKVVRDEVDDRFFNVSISVELSKVESLDIYRIAVKAKYPVFTKLLYTKERGSFKIFVDKSDVENFNKDNIKIVGI